MGEDTKIAVFMDALVEIRGDLETVRAIETLEYHDKNKLAYDNPTRSRRKIDMLTKDIEILTGYLTGEKDWHR